LAIASTVEFPRRDHLGLVSARSTWDSAVGG